MVILSLEPFLMAYWDSFVAIFISSLFAVFCIFIVCEKDVVILDDDIEL